MDTQKVLSLFTKDYVAYSTFAEPSDKETYMQHITAAFKSFSIRGCEVVPPDETVIKRWYGDKDIYELGKYGFTQTGDPLKPYTSLHRGHFLRIWKKVGNEFKINFYMNQLQYHIDMPQ